MATHRPDCEFRPSVEKNREPSSSNNRSVFLKFGDPETLSGMQEIDVGMSDKIRHWTAETAVFIMASWISCVCRLRCLWMTSSWSTTTIQEFGVNSLTVSGHSHL
jgi:hypothetical protein